MTLRPDVLKVRIGKIHPVAAIVRFPELNNLARPIVGQRSKQHSVNHPKDRGSCADPKRQREHRDKRKSRILPQHPQRIPQILNNGLHKALTPSSNGMESWDRSRLEVESPGSAPTLGPSRYGTKVVSPSPLIPKEKKTSLK